MKREQGQDQQCCPNQPPFRCCTLGKAGYRFKYRSLLSVVVGRSGPLIPGGGVFLKPSPQQLKQMQDALLR